MLFRSPKREIKRGAVTSFVPMDALPEHARQITRIERREFVGGGAKFRNRDTLLARITPCLENGKTAFVTGLAEDEVAHGSTEYIVISGKDDVSDDLFAYYLAQLPGFRSHAIASMEGTSGRQRVPNDAVSRYKLQLPPVTEQRAIALMLGTLDDKIELNRRMNETLEAMARAIFQSWFVDFDPVRAKVRGESPDAICKRLGLTPELLALFPDSFEDSELGEIPAGWLPARLDEILELAYGKALKATDRIDGEFPVYGSGGVTGYHNESLIDGPAIIVGRKGTVGSLYWEDRSSCPIDTVFYVKPKVQLTYCFYLLQTLALETMNTDAAVPGLNRNNVYRLLTSMPSEEVRAAFERLAISVRRQICANTEELKTLSKVRDTLLPKLLSGELVVSVREDRS